MNANMNSLKSSMSPSITKMIRMDHTAVLSVFHKYQMNTDPATKKVLVASVCRALEIHAQLEEEIFYPALRQVAGDDETLGKSEPEHNEMRRLIGELRELDPSDSRYDQTFMELMRDVMHHVADEETILLPKAEEQLSDKLGELGVQMTKRRLQLSAPHAREMAYNMARRMPARSMVIAAGALIAGSYMVRRAFARHP